MKTLYDPKVHPKLVYKLARKGLTDEEMCASMGIKKTAFYEWQKRHAEFAEACKEGKKRPNKEVEAALIRLCTGYEVTETVAKPGKNGRAEIVRVIRRQMPPNPTSVIFWLKNRMPAKWRDVGHYKVAGHLTTEGVPNLSKLSDEEVQALTEILEKATNGTGDRAGSGEATG